MRVSATGQVTIPKELRESVGMLAGTEVEFARDGEALILRRAEGSASGRGGPIVAALRGRGDVAMSTDEIMRLTRRA